jgi:hypothetical protein
VALTTHLVIPSVNLIRILKGAVFVDKATYYGADTMFSRVCGAIYGVNKENFRLWVPYKANGTLSQLFERAFFFINFPDFALSICYFLDDLMCLV